MRRNFLWAGVVIVAALLQMTWLDVVEVGQVRPDLPLLIVVYFALADGEERAMFSGVLAGVFQDIAGNNSLGHHVLCHVLIAYTVGRLAARLVTEHPAVKMILVFLASLVYGLMFHTIEYIQNPNVNLLNIIVALVVPAAFYTALVTPLVFAFLTRAFHGAEAPLQAGGRR